MIPNQALGGSSPSLPVKGNKMFYYQIERNSLENPDTYEALFWYGEHHLEELKEALVKLREALPEYKWRASKITEELLDL